MERPHELLQSARADAYLIQDVLDVGLFDITVVFDIRRVVGMQVVAVVSRVGAARVGFNDVNAALAIEDYAVFELLADDALSHGTLRTLIHTYVS